MTDFPFSLIEQKIQYVFKDKNLLYKAFIHSSFANQNGLESNERMELFGDAILEYLSTEYLFGQYPNKDDGALSKARASTISAVTLKKALTKLDLSQHLLMSKGAVTIKNSSFKLDSNLYESLLCAIYLDGGFANAKEFILRFILTDIEHKQLFYDSKTILQEVVQGKHEQLSYVLLEEIGPDHDKNFTVGVMIGDKQVSKGTGHTKKAAEQEAAYQIGRAHV